MGLLITLLINILVNLLYICLNLYYKLQSLSIFAARCILHEVLIPRIERAHLPIPFHDPFPLRLPWHILKRIDRLSNKHVSCHSFVSVRPWLMLESALGIVEPLFMIAGGHYWFSQCLIVIFWFGFRWELWEVLVLGKFIKRAFTLGKVDSSALLSACFSRHSEFSFNQFIYRSRCSVEKPHFTRDLNVTRFNVQGGIEIP